jgi:hypothetical protein
VSNYYKARGLEAPIQEPMPDGFLLFGGLVKTLDNPGPGPSGQPMFELDVVTGTVIINL